MKTINVTYRLVYTDTIVVEDDEDIRDAIDEHWTHILCRDQPEYDSVDYEVEE